MNVGLFKRAVASATGVLVYVAAFAWFVNNAKNIFGAGPMGWGGSLFLLLLFIISACVTGSLVLLKPALLYMDGQKKEALTLFAYTVVALAVLAFIVGVILFVTLR
jgi:hypothetical protein